MSESPVPEGPVKKVNRAEVESRKAALIQNASADFALEQRFPDIENTLAFIHRDLEEAKKDCLYLLDSNVLLFPFGVSAKALTEIKRVYSALSGQKRLRVAKHSVREYFKNKTEKIKTLYDGLDGAKFGVTPIVPRPLYSNDEAFLKAKALRDEIEDKVIEYKKCVNEIRAKVASWSLNDPVTNAYRVCFTEDTLVDLSIDDGKLSEIIAERLSRRQPPGFKDLNKPDNANGDVLIWLTALKIGQETGKDLVFVTEEKKGDWWVKSGNDELSPHFDLIDEYRRASKGGSLHIIKLTQMLALNDSDPQIVDEVSHAEPIIPVDVAKLKSAEWTKLRLREEYLRTVVMDYFSSKSIDIQEARTSSRLLMLKGLLEQTMLQIVVMFDPHPGVFRKVESKIRRFLRGDSVNFLFLVYDEDIPIGTSASIRKELEKEEPTVHVVSAKISSGRLFVVHSSGFTPFPVD